MTCFLCKKEAKIIKGLELSLDDGTAGEICNICAIKLMTVKIECNIYTVKLVGVNN